MEAPRREMTLVEGLDDLDIAVLVLAEVEDALVAALEEFPEETDAGEREKSKAKPAGQEERAEPPVEASPR